MPTSPSARSPTSPQQRQAVPLFSVPEAVHRVLENFLPQHVLDSVSNVATRGSDLPFPVNTEETVSPISETESGQTPKECHEVYVSDTSDVEVTTRNCERAPETKILAGGLKTWTRAPEKIQTLVDKARKRIESHRLSESNLDVVDESGNPVSGCKSMYLVCDEDIEAVVETILQEARKIETYAEEEQKKVGQAKSKDRPSLPKFKGDNIQPHAAAIADPATTISLPKTSYINMNPSDKHVYTKTRGLEISTTTTFISRKSIAEITWTNGERNTSIDPLRKYSGSTITTGSASGIASPIVTGFREQTTFNGFSLHQYPMPDSLNDAVAHANRTQSNAQAEGEHTWCNTQSKGDKTAITSFPELRSRHCTSEWLKPPMEMQLVETATDDLYHHGVDAHCGNPSRSSVVFVEDEPQKPRHCNHNMFGENPFCTDHEDAAEDRLAGCPRSSVIEKRLGTSIGTAAHRRKSSQIGSIATSGHSESHDSLVPGIIEKIRKSGHKIFHRNRPHKSDDLNSGEFGTPRNSPEEAHPTSKARSRDSITMERTPPLPQVDRNGIYEAMTGSKMRKQRKRADTCSEDHRPHMCEEDLLTPMSGALTPR